MPSIDITYHDLEETPSLDRVGQLFEELFLERRANPTHLYVCLDDYEALNNEVKATTKPAPGQECPEDAKLSHVINPTLGNMVAVVESPWITPHSVGIGEYR